MRHQRGISLVATAVVIGLIAFVLVLGLVSMRQDRNLFGELLGSVKKSELGRQVQNAGAATAVTPGAAAQGPIRKCVIDGQTVYSNVDCKEGHVVKVQDTAGFEAPKAPPPPEASPKTMQDKAIEAATR